MLKFSLTNGRFQSYIQIIEEETESYIKSWNDEGHQDLQQIFTELMLMTASRCLHGKEIRGMLNTKVAKLYRDLGKGFCYAAWLLPSWLPIPTFRNRDKANKEMKIIFDQVIDKRIENNVTEDDILDTLMNSKYRNGQYLSKNEISGMLLGFLLAGQHTSSTSSSWLGFYLAKNKLWQDSCFKELQEVSVTENNSIDSDKLKELNTLECCIKEALRLRPPVMTMIRSVKTPQRYKNFYIPVEHQVCVSPTINQSLPSVWKDPEVFNPDRFKGDGCFRNEKFSYIPFGAGRHRCIGEIFAYLQMKTIWTVLIRHFEFDLINDYFPTVNHSSLIHTPNNPVIAYKRRK
ncbi:Lanosterol 14-alpha demethylase [Trichoplax sp. H2]|nr:Lanosterol 14-alpha demethylase [Trichoplax sp. H2]|eukprot:RDD36322.1 Lanosterol 14-alpha demethylase [Trichoplax sp. H2]